MTLLEDLEISAANAELLGDNIIAARLRAHAERLRVEYACAVEKSLLPHSSGRTKALVARINNGPVR